MNGFCLFSFANFTLDLNGFIEKKLKITQNRAEENLVVKN